MSDQDVEHEQDVASEPEENVETDDSLNAAGCLAVASPNPANQQTPIAVNASSAYCLYRYGILLAANAQAHRYWPKLPVVDAYEQSIVQQLMPHS